MDTPYRIRGRSYLSPAALRLKIERDKVTREKAAKEKQQTKEQEEHGKRSNPAGECRTDNCSAR